jgi:hypothetical protein
LKAIEQLEKEAKTEIETRKRGEKEKQTAIIQTNINPKKIKSLSANPSEKEGFALIRK